MLSGTNSWSGFDAEWSCREASKGNGNHHHVRTKVKQTHIGLDRIFEVSLMQRRQGTSRQGQQQNLLWQNSNKSTQVFRLHVLFWNLWMQGWAEANEDKGKHQCHIIKINEQQLSHTQTTLWHNQNKAKTYKGKIFVLVSMQMGQGSIKQRQRHSTL